MEQLKFVTIVLVLLLEACSHTPSYKKAKDPLPSWNNTAIKTSIIQYVSLVTEPESKNFIPVEDRIATFDNDGTLWAEMPPNEIIFTETEAAKLGIKHKPLKNMNKKEILELLFKTHTGMNTEKFSSEVDAFFAHAIHPTLKVPLNKTIYQPQLELLKYLSSNGFKIYICSGGTTDFMRVISEKYYDVPPEQVIGTTFELKFDEARNSVSVLPKVHDINDKELKASNIERVIGKRPVFAAGNVRSGGDLYMLRYSQGSEYPNFQLMINHDDSMREFAYEEKDGASLKWAEKYKWNVLSMRDDWKKVFTE